MFQKINAPQVARHHGHLFMSITFFICSFFFHDEVSGRIVLIGYFVIFIQYLIMRVRPHLYIENKVVFVYKHFLLKPHEIPIHEIDTITLTQIEKGIIHKDVYKLHFSLKENKSFECLLSDDIDPIKIKDFFKRNADITLLLL